MQPDFTRRLDKEQRTYSESDITRFWKFVDKREPHDCWLWLGGKTERGYGLFWVDRHTVSAHRFCFEVLRAPIPQGLVLDHFYCKNTSCVNPDHLEPVTDLINVVIRGSGPTAINAKKTHCLNGHPFEGKNLSHVRTTGGGVGRVCLACAAARMREYRKARREAKEANWIKDSA